MTSQETKYMTEIRLEAQKVTKETMVQEFRKYFLPFTALVSLLFVISCSFFWYIQDASTNAMNNIAHSLEKLADAQSNNAIAIAVHDTKIKTIEKDIEKRCK